MGGKYLNNNQMDSDIPVTSLSETCLHIYLGVFVDHVVRMCWLARNIKIICAILCLQAARQAESGVDQEEQTSQHKGNKANRMRQDSFRSIQIAIKEKKWLKCYEIFSGLGWFQ